MTWTALEAALAVQVQHVHPVSGGSINEAHRVETDRGPIFVKRHRSPPRGFFEAEVDGLERLRRAGVRVPDVLAVASDWLALRWLDPGPPRFEDAGRMLALLHTQRASGFGLERDNFMGAVQQDNAAGAQSFHAFFRTRRIEPLAVDLPSRLRHRLDALDLSFLEPDGPHLVHGDLWSGNLMHTNEGPVFIDPAVHYGHPEQDLAMTRLFGGFPPAFEAAYREAAGLPRHPDQEFPRRVTALNLYPLLVHVRLFGGSYVHSVEAALDTLRA